MVTFLLFDRFIQYKIVDGSKQRLALLKKQEHSILKGDKSRKTFATHIS